MHRCFVSFQVLFVLPCFVFSSAALALLTGPVTLRPRPLLHPRAPQFGGPVISRSRLTRSAEEMEGGSSSSSSSSTGESGSAFDWTNFTEPEEYVWYLRDDGGVNNNNSNRAPGQAEDITVQWNAPITILALLFFVPLFSAEFFFAISRSFICASPWTADLCSAVPNFSERI